MRTTIQTALLALSLVGVQTSAAISGESAPETDAFFAFQEMPAEELETQSGKNNVFGVGNVGQQSEADLKSQTVLSPLENSGTMSTGAIDTASVSANRGVVMFTQNTGDLVNITKNLSINVYLQ